jgi:excisionase family DNA binding protein
VTPEPEQLVENLLRLEDVLAGTTDTESREHLLAVREFLSKLAGPTLRPAEVARLLGVSRPALKRWLDGGEISSVTTPQGRREVPLTEVIDLVRSAREEKEAGAGRPLAQVMRERQRRAEEAIDLQRLVPRRQPRTHRVPELHSLAYHRLVAERLSPKLVDDARQRLNRWRDEGRIDPRWAERWEAILTLPLPDIARRISSDGPRARELRQTSPFAGALNEHERRLLGRAVEERASA